MPVDTVAADQTLSREEALFLVVITGLAGAGAAGIVTDLIAAAAGPAEPSVWLLVAGAIALAVTGAAFWGVYRAILTGSVVSKAIYAYVLLSMFVVGGDGWQVELVEPSLTFVASASVSPIRAGGNVLGIALVLWYASLRRRVSTG